MMIKQLSLMSFSLLVLAACCVGLALAGYLPEPGQGLIKTVLLAILALNLLVCMLNRWRVWYRIRTVRQWADLLLHLGVVLIILAGFMSTAKQVASIELNEHQTRDLTAQGFPIAIRADDIQVLRYPNGEVKQYITEVSIIEENRVAKRASISVNHPLHYRDLKIYQSTFSSDKGVDISGLTVKTAPGLSLLWVGLTLLGAGSMLMWWGGVKK